LLLFSDNLSILPDSVIVKRKLQNGSDILAKTNDFGKEVKIRLVEMEKNQAWLIEQVKEKTGLYFDDSYLWKINAGVIATPSIVNAIREILGMEEA